MKNVRILSLTTLPFTDSAWTWTLAELEGICILSPNCTLVATWLQGLGAKEHGIKSMQMVNLESMIVADHKRAHSVWHACHASQHLQFCTKKNMCSFNCIARSHRAFVFTAILGTCKLNIRHCALESHARRHMACCCHVRVYRPQLVSIKLLCNGNKCAHRQRHNRSRS